MTLDQFKSDLRRRFPWRPGMNYMAVDNGGMVCQYETRPGLAPGDLLFWVTDFNSQFVQMVEIPDGVDWRDTLIARPAT